MWDGSNFDAHQHHSLIQAVDNQCIRHVLKNLCFRLGFTLDQYEEIKKHILDLDAFFTMYYPKTRKKLLQGQIKGTTFTGHPVRTTFGNTMRMYYYTNFIMTQHDIKVVQFHAGDDVLVMGEASQIDKLVQWIPEYAVTTDEEIAELDQFKKNTDLEIDMDEVNPKNVKTKGLGQIFRDFKTSFTDFDFLSKDGRQIND